jgi:3-hydroxyisobutyrate dehydrogenase-like beta-hydroxyacid dehydrogenase
MKVAFLGLGIMGRPMAANLVKAGHEVSVWNRTPGKTVEGATSAATPAQAARNAEVVWMCVSDTAAVEKVLFGESGVEQSLRPGMIVADSSTISPASTSEFAKRVRAKGADYVDAPVTGSKIGAEAGQLIFIAGGAENTITRLQPLFSAMGKQVLHMGDTGKGQSAKIAANLMIAMIYEGFAEGLTLAQKLGVDPERLVGLVQASMIRSGVVDYKAPFVLKRDYSPNFPLRLMHKDIHLVLDAAQQLGLNLPGIGAVEHVYEESVRAGHANDDYAATLAVIEKWAGLNR